MNSDDKNCPAKPIEQRTLFGMALCPILYMVGFVCVALGFVGIFVPGMPTTVFLLIALWCFSRSSEKARNWLWTHKRLGPYIRDWHEHRVVPRTAKILAVFMMCMSVFVVAMMSELGSLNPIFLAMILAPIAVFLITRPSEPGQKAEERLDD